MAVLQPARIKDRQAIEEIRALKPDVIVVMAYGQILPRGVLEIPKIACLNLHASLLPRWRGAAPVQAAIAAGDRETGITVMYMDEGLDTGDILLQRIINILPSDTGGALHDRLAEVAPETLLESLDLLAKGKAPRTPQDNSLATSAPKLKREDGNIDWSDPADAIEQKDPRVQSVAWRVYDYRSERDAQFEDLFSNHCCSSRNARGNFAQRKRVRGCSWQRRVIARRSAAGGKATDDRDRISARTPHAVILIAQAREKTSQRREHYTNVRM